MEQDVCRISVRHLRFYSHLSTFKIIGNKNTIFIMYLLLLDYVRDFSDTNNSTTCIQKKIKLTLLSSFTKRNNDGNTWPMYREQLICTYM